MRDHHPPQPTPIAAPIWQCGRYTLPMTQPIIMGILNLTPDSFSDGGRYISPELAAARAHNMIEQGAHIIDIGGESTRPNAPAVSCCEELRRIVPTITALIDCGVPISIDTRKPYVMREVLNMGVDIINDVSGFNNPVAIEAVADSGCGLCIMHMQGTPQTMQHQPEYDDVVQTVAQFFTQQTTRLQQAGIAPERLCLDPGIGFGKTLEHNRALLQALHQLQPNQRQHPIHPPHPNYPMLIGVSRKSMIGTLTEQTEPEQRMSGSVSAALWSLAHGAHIVRVHDVRETADALKVWAYLDVPSNPRTQ